MSTTRNYGSYTMLAVLFGFLYGTSLSAQEGKLKVKAHPPEAYVFIDGQAIGQGNRTLTVNAGEHKLGVYNYGYLPMIRDVTVTAGAVSHVDATLEPISSTVSGPWGSITIEGAVQDAILLNGKTPEFFVGHGDEFNHEWWWKQELIVPPGTHQLTAMREGKEIWSGPVEVSANQRVVVDIPGGARKSVPWPRGDKLTSLPRFKAGMASASVAVAKPAAQLAAGTEQINCGQSSLLKWSSSDAGRIEIKQLGEVQGSGEQAIQPKQTTTYELSAFGPGGTATSSATVAVNSSVRAQLDLSPAEVHYKRIGDKVVQESSTALNWSASNADSVSIDPIGFVDANGNKTVRVSPQRKDPGTVDETVTYTLTATNVCGGTETRTATLHITGSIEDLEKELAMRSIYFPTDLPRHYRIQKGLVRSQQKTLEQIAVAFKEYLANKPNAHLILAGHADQRGPSAYNQALSERRAELAKRFLVHHGVPAENLDTQAFGEERNLNSEEVRTLLDKNPDLTQEMREEALRKMATTVYAHNRRVDISLSATGQQSVRQYPFRADDFDTLVKRGPALKGGVELATETQKVQN